MSFHYIGPFVCHLTLHGEMHGDFLIGHPSYLPFHTVSHFIFVMSFKTLKKFFLKKNPLQPLKDDYT
jgi:hypothetical protein